MGLVRDDREREVAHRTPGPDGQQPVNPVERLDAVGECLHHDQAQGPSRLGDRRRACLEIAIERERVVRAHRTTRLTSLPPPATTIRSGAFPSRIALILSRARTAASISAVEASAATT